MSNNQNTFPAKDADFNQYITDAVPYLVAEAVRLSISAGNVTELGTRKTAWDNIYGQAKNPITATGPIIRQKSTQRKEFETFLRRVFKDIPNSALTENDRSLLNLPERDTKTPRGKIVDIPLVGMTPKGGGSMQFKVRTNEDSTRPSMHPLADVVEVTYKLVDPKQDPEGRQRPLSPKDCTHKDISSKSTFTVSLGLEHAGYIMYAYVRWGNASKPANSGDYTDLMMKIII
jgi:hypothetical protein